jgi:hypothetical protein
VSNWVCQLQIPFAVRGNTVFWGAHEIPDADPRTFVGLSNVWGVDHESVFTEWRRRNIDRSTFEFLNGVFVRDRAHVYDCQGIVEGADPQSFACLDAGLVSEDGKIINYVWQRSYAKDSQHVFYHDQMTGRASVVRGADPQTFVSFGNSYGRDQRAAEFRVLLLPTIGNYATDGRTWFRNDSPIPKAEFDSAVAQALASLPKSVSVALASDIPGRWPHS